MPKRKGSSDTIPPVVKTRRTEKLSPLIDPSILKDRRVLLVQKLQLDSILPGLKPYLKYPEIDKINAEPSRGGRIGTLIEYLQRRVAAKSYEAFNAFMKMIAGCQPELFEEVTGRGPTQDEIMFCVKEFGKEVKDVIESKGHSMDSALDEKIDLDSERMELTIVMDPPSPDTINSLPHKYQSYLSSIQENEKNIPARKILGSKSNGNKPQRISLHGRGGIGKSTTMQWLARQWAKNKMAPQFAFLFLLQLRMLEVSHCSMTAIELLTLYGLYQVNNPDLSHVLSCWLRNFAGKIIVFIDGLDEVADFKARLRNCPKISDLNQKAHPIDLCLNILRGDLLPGCTLISASRPFSGLKELNFDRQFEILGLTEARVVDFVQRKHPSKAEDIISYLKENRILMSMCGITFYCGLISGLLAEGVVFTNDDLSTYTRLTAFIIVQCVTRKMPKWPFVIEVGSYFPKLSKMAYMGMFGKQLKGEIAMIVFDEYDMNEAELSPQELDSIQSTGLLHFKNRTGLRRSIIAEFFHLSVQEMLASAYLLSHPLSLVNTLQKLFSEGQFNMSLLYLFGLQFDSHSPWIKDIVSSTNRSRHTTRFDIIGQIDTFLEDLCKQSRFRREFNNRLQICQLIHEGQIEAKAKWMARDIAPNGKLHIFSTHMTVIDLMAVRFVCKYLSALKEISITSSHFTCTQVQFLTSELLMDHSATLNTLDLSCNDMGNEGAMAIGSFLRQNHRLQTLNLSNDEEIGNVAARAIAEGLKDNHTLQNLDLSLDGISDDGAKSLAEALLCNDSLQTLNVRRNDIEKDGGQAIAGALIRNRTLLELHLGMNNIGSHGAKALGKALKKNKTLKVLNVDNNHISSEGAKGLAEGLLENDTLRTLVVSRNSFGDHGAKELAKVLQHNHSLEILDVSDNEVDSDGSAALAKALHMNKGLCSLDVKFNNIGDKGGKAFATALRKNDTLQMLDLSGNSKGCDSLKALALGLRHNTTLQSLHIRKNEIGENGAEELAEVLRHNSHLKTLDVRLNKIGIVGAKVVAEALRENTSLETLIAGNNRIHKEGATALADALRHNNTLKTMDLRSNKIGDDGARALAEALHHNTSLQTLSLLLNDVGEEGAHALAKALQQNTSLHTLDLARTRIGEDGFIELALALHKNKTLHTLSVTGLFLSDKGAKVLAEAMHHNSNLQTLKVGLSKRIGEDVVRALSEVLQQGQSGSWHPLK